MDKIELSQVATPELAQHMSDQYYGLAATAGVICVGSLLALMPADTLVEKVAAGLAAVGSGIYAYHTGNMAAQFMHQADEIDR